jgi:hypothetical protein
VGFWLPALSPHVPRRAVHCALSGAGRGFLDPAGTVAGLQIHPPLTGLGSRGVIP